MTTIASGIFKKVARKRQSALGTKATADSGTSQYLRRVTSTIDIGKSALQSAELLTSQQRRASKHGVKAVTGSISGELSVGTYQKEFESVLRKAVATAPTTGAVTDVTATDTGTAVGTFVRGTGSFLTDGFKIGDIVRWTGFAGGSATNNNSHNMLITGLTATVMTVLTLDGEEVISDASGDSVTCTLVGKRTWVPQTGHTRDYYTIEHWFSDIAQSEQFVDCVYTGANISMPPNAIATVEFPVMGLDMDTGTAQYFTAPAAESTGDVVTSVTRGALLIGGAVAGVVTGLTINIAGNHSVPGGVIASDVDPDIFPGPLTVSGQMTILFANATYRDLFLNETESSVICAMCTDDTATSDFICFVMSRVKFNGSTKDDTAAGLTLTLPFEALENTAGGDALANLATTISIQDSDFA